MVELTRRVTTVVRAVVDNNPLVPLASNELFGGGSACARYCCFIPVTSLRKLAFAQK
jgi:hypothetical protein